MSEAFDIIVIGGGPAGLTAAIYARRAGKSVLVLEKESFGGQIADAPKVENFPGFPAISGVELSDRMYQQAEELGARIELEEVLEIQDGPQKTVVTDYGSYTGTALILATGMKRRKLDLPGEGDLRGISFCAVCDGAFYREQDVAVVGGGNSALQDALFLSELCRHVTLIHRRRSFRADPILVEQLRERENVSFCLSAQVKELRAQDGALTGIIMEDPANGTQLELAVSGLFEAVGHLPEQALLSTLIPLDQAGFAPVGEDCVTSAAGIFVAGDCRAKEVRQLTTACADGAVAALAASRYCDAASSR